MPYYTTKGSVRGDCGHRHRSIKAAVKCLCADHKGCQKQGGYSDRSVVRFDGKALTEEDQRWVDYLLEN